MNVDTSNWDYQDYLAFLMVYAAFADFQINEREQAFIKKRVGREEFEKMFQHFKELRDIQRIDIILEFKKKFCHNEDDLNKILRDFVDVLKEDHEIGAEEEAVFLGIRRLLRETKES